MIITILFTIRFRIQHIMNRKFRTISSILAIICSYIIYLVIIISYITYSRKYRNLLLLLLLIIHTKLTFTSVLYINKRLRLEPRRVIRIIRLFFPAISLNSLNFIFNLFSVQLLLIIIIIYM